MKSSGADFTQLSRELLRRGHCVRFEARGSSMQPEILHGDIVTVEPVEGPLADRDIVLCLSRNGNPLLHRIIRSRLDPAGQPSYLLRGDARVSVDGWTNAERILGRMVAVERRGRLNRLPLSMLAEFVRRFRCWIARGDSA